MFDMLNLRERPIFEQMRAQNPSAPRDAARAQAAREWNARVLQQRRTRSSRRCTRAGAPSAREPTTRGVPGGRGAHQRPAPAALVSRYFKVKMRDVGGTAIMLLQAPIIGVLLALVFGGQKDAIPFWCLGALQELAQEAAAQASGIDATCSNSMQTTHRPHRRRSSSWSSRRCGSAPATPRARS